MEILLFLVGILAGVGGTVGAAAMAAKKKDADTGVVPDEDDRMREMLQFENFMNYDGSERGQKEL